MGRTTRRWRDLDAAVDRGGWFIEFHFHDGTVIQAHKYVVGLRRSPRSCPKGHARDVMPELPEVETVRRGLLPVMEGRRIVLAQVNRPDLRWPLPDRMADRLTGARVLALRRRSKYILADLSTGKAC